MTDLEGIADLIAVLRNYRGEDTTALENKLLVLADAICDAELASLLQNGHATPLQRPVSHETASDVVQGDFGYQDFVDALKAGGYNHIPAALRAWKLPTSADLFDQETTAEYRAERMAALKAKIAQKSAIPEERNGAPDISKCPACGADEWDARTSKYGPFRKCKRCEATWDDRPGTWEKKHAAAGARR